MFIEIILLIAVVILLFLIYRILQNSLIIKEQLDKEQERKFINYQNWLYEELTNINKKITELSNVLTIENPAWGENSATSKKNENLVKLYSHYLIDNEKISQKEALCKATFIVNNFDKGITDEMQRDIKFKNEIKFERELLSSDLFKIEVQEKVKKLTPVDIYEPLYIGITNKIIKKGDALFQNTDRAFEAYSGDYGYKCYVEDAAIINKLEQLKIFSLKKDGNELRKSMSGHLSYILNEDDLAKIRKIVFVDNENSEYYNDQYFIDRNPEGKKFELPFKASF